jgi:GNAT superfamily N-acetyltransferase
MENVRIETYSKKHQHAVGQLIISIQRDEFEVPITLEDQPDLKNIETFYQTANGNFWVALLNDNVIGTIALIDIGNQQVALRKMFVSKLFRGKPHNTGQLLMDEAFRWMVSKNVKEVILGTLDKFIAAQRFYRRNGFFEIAKENLPPNFPRMTLDNMFFIKSISSDGVEVQEFQPEHQPWFEKLNRDWIEKFFWMEPVDFQVLQQPEEHIIKHGGTILMAYHHKEIAGTVALKFVEKGVYEFTKMAVDERFRGKKIGKALAESAIIKAKSLGADKIILYSNTILAPAIALYRKIGFVEIPVDGPYKRSNIKMELKLKNS